MDRKTLSTLDVAIHRTRHDGSIVKVSLREVIENVPHKHTLIGIAIKDVSRILTTYLNPDSSERENETFYRKLIYADIVGISQITYADRLFRTNDLLSHNELDDLEISDPRVLHRTVIETSGLEYRSDFDFEKEITSWIKEINDYEVSRFEGGETGIQ
jgi:hypothetical protein